VAAEANTDQNAIIIKEDEAVGVAIIVMGMVVADTMMITMETIIITITTHQEGIMVVVDMTRVQIIMIRPIIINRTEEEAVAEVEDAEVTEEGAEEEEEDNTMEVEEDGAEDADVAVVVVVAEVDTIRIMVAAVVVAEEEVDISKTISKLFVSMMQRMKHWIVKC